MEKNTYDFKQVQTLITLSFDNIITYFQFLSANFFFYLSNNLSIHLWHSIDFFWLIFNLLVLSNWSKYQSFNIPKLHNQTKILS